MVSFFANPRRFDALVRYVALPCGVLGGGLLLTGWWIGLFGSPIDYQQGNAVRMMYAHVPAAWMAMFCYACLAGASFFSFVWRHTVADAAAQAVAPLGAVFTALALITGSIWGKPMWGTWWAWDARLTSVLILFFLYIGYMVLRAAIEDPARGARLSAIAAMVGVVILPIIRFSVVWWNSLHQQASVLRMGGPAMPADFLTPLLLSGLGYTFLFVWLWLWATQAEMDKRRLRAQPLGRSAAPSRPVPMAQQFVNDN